MFLPPGFDRAIVLEAAALVNQAYDQYEKFTHGASWSIQGNYDTLGLLSARPPASGEEPFGFVVRNRTSGNVFVTFRGTQSIEDWLSNLSFPQVPHPWGHAEKGFNDLYDQCAAATRAAVRLAPAASSVFVTGHSLGSALATLATADLADSGLSPDVGMYNFASPRVGDRVFADRFNARVASRWRIVNTEDIVTSVPIATPELSSSSLPNSPFAMFLMLAHHLDYEHVGNAVTFTTHNGSIIANHQMPTYISAL
jgi:triacylglycerol lipase